MNEPNPDYRTLGEIADELGFPVDAIILVADLAHVLVSKAYYADMAEVPHVDANGLCRLLRWHARSKFGRDTASVFAEWNIHRSEDIGRIVFALVSAGYLEKSPDDVPEHFDGLFLARDYFA